MADGGDLGGHEAGWEMKSVQIAFPQTVSLGEGRFGRLERSGEGGGITEAIVSSLGWCCALRTEVLYERLGGALVHPAFISFFCCET